MARHTTALCVLFSETGLTYCNNPPSPTLESFPTLESHFNSFVAKRNAHGLLLNLPRVERSTLRIAAPTGYGSGFVTKDSTYKNQPAHRKLEARRPYSGGTWPKQWKGYREIVVGFITQRRPQQNSQYARMRKQQPLYRKNGNSNVGFMSTSEAPAKPIAVLAGGIGNKKR